MALYINKTYFVDNSNTIASQTIPRANISDMNNLSFSVNLPEIVPSQDYVFARIGVKIANVEDRLFSPVTLVSLK